MADLLFESDDEANTPLTVREREGLIPSYITLRHELNEAEQVNIAAAIRWAYSRKRNVLDRDFLRELHRRMFGDVWQWAGKHRILTDLQGVINDARYWVDHSTYPPDEIAVRFSHRVVAIHPFPNGNGRFSRLIGDLLARELGRPAFTWGQASLTGAGETRARYVDALRAADNHDITPLLIFARS